MMSKNAPMFKPWKDGLIENSIKLSGVALFFLFLSGVFGAGYDPIKTNPYVWGLYVRSIPARVIELIQ